MKHPTLAIMILLLASACARTPRVLPEITANLEVGTWMKAEQTGRLAGILAHDNHLFLIRTTGTLLKIDPANGNRVLVSQVAQTLLPGIIAAEGNVLLKSAGSRDWIILDLNTLKEKARVAPDSPGSRIVALGKNSLVFREKEKLKLRGFSGNPLHAQWELKPGEFRSCRISGDTIFLLLQNELVEFASLKPSPQRHPLPFPAAGGFLPLDKYIYYGSENRLLVKWSPASDRTAWAIRLPRTLLLSPMQVDNWIAITPKDQHIHFYSPRGGSYWWAPLDSTRLFPPLRLKDNIAVLMYPASSPDIRFFNWKTRQSVSQKLDSQPVFPPVALGGAIFCVTAPVGKHQVERIANRRGMKIDLEPKFPLLTNHSIEFRITPFNLIQPRFHLKLLRNGAEKPIWEETLPEMESPARAWLPGDSGEYTLEVEGKSLDGFSVTARESFTVLDPGDLIRETLSRIQAACRGSAVTGGRPD